MDLGFLNGGDFGANEDWCAKAAAVWAKVTGNAAEAEKYRVQCTLAIDPFPAAGKPVIWGEPWTEAGRGWRHLPWAFSTSEDFTRNPGSPSIWYTGAASDAVNSMIDSGLKAAAGLVDKGAQAANTLFTGGESGKSTNPADPVMGVPRLQMREQPPMMMTKDTRIIGGASPDVVGQVAPSYYPSPSGSNTMLIVGGVAVLGLVAFMMLKGKKTAGAMAGYSHRKGSRRARRSRR